MPMSISRFVPHEHKTSVIRIYSYDGGCPVGTLSNAHFGSLRVFRSAIELLKIIEELQDEINFPQKSMTTRRFKAEATAARMITEEHAEFEGKSALAGFKISILFRQNASWQGSISWIEKDTTTEFRSVLELLLLIDSVINGTGE
jgi:hypothetical protein